MNLVMYWVLKLSQSKAGNEDHQNGKIEFFLQTTLSSLAMSIQRRLLHSARCLRAESTSPFHLPTPSQPDPLSPPNPSLQSDTPRVSLSAYSMRKVGAREWSRHDIRRESTPSAENLERRDMLQAALTKLFPNGPSENVKAAMEKRFRPVPIPAPRIALHLGND